MGIPYYEFEYEELYQQGEWCRCALCADEMGDYIVYIPDRNEDGERREHYYCHMCFVQSFREVTGGRVRWR